LACVPRDDYKAVVSDLDEHAKRFKDVLAANEGLDLGNDVKQGLLRIRPALDSYIASAETSVALASRDRDGARAKLPEFVVAFGKLETEMEEISGLIEKQVTVVAEGERAALAQFQLVLTSTSGAALAVLVTLTILITRGLNRSLRRVTDTLSAGAEQTASAAAQVSSSSQSLAQGSTEQAASLEETGASIEQMSAMS
jgi:methyl-accepting chemotaxis protein